MKWSKLFGTQQTWSMVRAVHESVLTSMVCEPERKCSVSGFLPGTNRCQVAYSLLQRFEPVVSEGVPRSLNFLGKKAARQTSGGFLRQRLVTSGVARSVGLSRVLLYEYRYDEREGQVSFFDEFGNCPGLARPGFSITLAWSA